MGLVLYKPKLAELTFRQELLSDPETMAYNHVYGGCISFGKERWLDWYARWMHEPDHFYRYLYDPQRQCWVGEVAWHYDMEMDKYMLDVIVKASERNRGYGRAGLALLCQAAKEAGLRVVYDLLASDNPSLHLFLDSGFTIVETVLDEGTLVQKRL